MKKYLFALEWFRADGSSTLGGAETLDDASRAAVELAPRDCVRVVIKQGRTYWRQRSEMATKRIKERG